MKAVLAIFQAGIALVPATVAVYRLANPIPAGERLIARATIEEISGSGFIPQGMRAVAVPVNEMVGDARFVVAGMYIDVIISSTLPSVTGGLGTHTRTLLQNVMVLSAGKDFARDAEGKPASVKVVNLLVTPEQAEQLSLASHQTTIQLILRNPPATPFSRR